MNRHRYIEILVGAPPEAGQPSNLDLFLAEAAKRGEKVLGYERRRDVWRVKVMARPET